MDGNNSLKRIGATVRQHDDLFDSQTIDSDWWIMAEEVDRFKNEVAQVFTHITIMSWNSWLIIW